MLDWTRSVLPQNGTEFIDWAQKLTTDVNGKHPNEEGFDKDNVADLGHLDWTWPRFTVPQCCGSLVVASSMKM
ncbi:MAG: hypothetical protein H6639_17970 [Caldilineaceae bacterium]|nr:hypothetical protein [Caldilineaceae bacterium]